VKNKVKEMEESFGCWIRRRRRFDGVRCVYPCNESGSNLCEDLARNGEPTPSGCLLSHHKTPPYPDPSKSNRPRSSASINKFLHTKIHNLEESIGFIDIDTSTKIFVDAVGI